VVRDQWFRASLESFQDTPAKQQFRIGRYDYMTHTDEVQNADRPATREPSFIYVFIFLLLLGSFKLRDSALPESSLPRMNILESKAQTAAKIFLDSVWGPDATRGWNARLMYRAFQKVEGDVTPAPELYPKQEIDYLLRHAPAEYVRLAERYKLGALGLVRFSPVSRDRKEAVDVYLSGSYEVYGMILHNWPVQEDSLDKTEFKALAMNHLKRLPGWDDQLYQTSEPAQDPDGMWHMDWRDPTPPKNLECGYKLVAKNSQLLRMMPYVKLDSQVQTAIAAEASGWKVAQRVAAIFIILFFVSGLAGMIRTKNRSASSVIFMLVLLFNISFEGADTLTVKLRQIFGDAGVMGFVGGAVFVLGTLLIYYSYPGLARKALPASKSRFTGYIPYLILIAIMAVQALGQDDLTSMQRYAYANGSRWILMNWLGAYLGFPVLCLGTALYYRHLSSRLASVRHGGWLSILLAVVLSASCLLIVNPQNYSAPLVINSLIYLIVMTAGLYFIRYEADAKSHLIYSFSMLSLTLRIMPSAVGTTHEDIWFRLLKIGLFIGMALLFDSFYRQSPWLWAKSRATGEKDRTP